MTVAEEVEITAKDDVSSKSDEDKAGVDNAKYIRDGESEEKGDVRQEDPLMNASDVINSMRSAIEESIRNIEPPMPLFRRPMQRQHWGDVQVRRLLLRCAFSL